MDDRKRDVRSPAEIFRVEAEAEAEQNRLCQESKHQLANRCPECGSLGSMELVDGLMRCIDCDEVVAAARQLSGFGRR